ncbi:MAG TPA: GNAT family N-acetyltransferase [Anaerolineales bacterium]|nr:GNAT family N-acetyltransferase [Anaerolineales bacterium]
MSTQVLTTQEVRLPDPPAIPGLSFRAFRGEADHPLMAAVLEGSKDADKIERVDTAEDIARAYGHLTNCDPYSDMLFAEVDGRVIGYNRVTWRQEYDGKRVYVNFGFLLPAWRRLGIGTAMMLWSESRLRSIASSHPRDGARAFESYAADTEIAAAALLKSLGYSAVRHGFRMVRRLMGEIPGVPLPEGLEVRPVLPEQYRTIWQANEEAFRDHWAARPRSEEEYQLWLKEPHFNPHLWMVAWDGAHVAGMVLNFINAAENTAYGRQRGYTEEVCVRRPWRRRGLAKALLARSLSFLREQGMEEAALSVDTANPNGALQLYESLGYQVVKQNSIYQKPLG